MLSKCLFCRRGHYVTAVTTILLISLSGSTLAADPAGDDAPLLEPVEVSVTPQSSSVGDVTADAPEVAGAGDNPGAGEDFCPWHRPRY